MTQTNASGGSEPQLQLQSETDAEKRARRVAHIFVAIAVLATVAAALFTITKGSGYMKKRQIGMIQRSARADLQLIYDAEVEFKKLNGTFTTDLKALKVWPKYALYAFGFVTPAKHDAKLIEALKLDPTTLTLNRLVEVRTADAVEMSKKDPNILPVAPIKLSPVTQIKSIELKNLSTLCGDCTATTDRFKAIVAAQLDQDSDLDVWTIDHLGQITHIVNDLSR